MKKPLTLLLSAVAFCIFQISGPAAFGQQAPLLQTTEATTQQSETPDGESIAPFLSAEQAVAVALENNYSIRLSRLSEKILENNVTIGNAGMLPVLDATAAQNNSITNSRQEYLDGRVNERDNAKANTLNAGVELNWLLFDGMRMFTGYDILKAQLAGGQLQTRLEIENTISEVLRQYYNIVQLRQKVTMFERSVGLGRIRTKIADEKLAIGAGSRLELLQARVDMNADISELLNLNDLITEATINMNLLLARSANAPFTVEDSITLMPPAEYATLKSRMERNNANLLLNRNDLELAGLNLKNIKGRRYPDLGLSMGYNFNRQESQSGFISAGKSDGFTYGLSARLPLFDGFNRSREERNARIGIETATLEHERYVADLNAQLLSTYSVYTNKLKTIELERENLETAYTNFDIANERYRLGELSGIEIREAQQNLLQAEDRLISLVYQARLLEIDLMQLAGEIVPSE